MSHRIAELQSFIKSYDLQVYEVKVDGNDLSISI